MSTQTKRRRLVIVSGVLLAVGAVSLIIIYQLGQRRLNAAIERFESEIGVLDAATHAPPAVPEHENAVTWLQKGFAALALSDSEHEAVGAYWVGDHATLSPEVEEILRREVPALDHLRHAGTLGASNWGVSYPPEPDAIPDLLEPLRSAKLLVADAHAGLREDDRKRVLADLKALAALHRALENEPLLVFQLIASSVELMLYNLVRDLLPSDLADSIFLRQVAALLASEKASHPIQASFAIDAAGLQDTIELQTKSATNFQDQLSQITQPLWAPFEVAAVIDLYYAFGKAAALPASQVEAAVQSYRSSAPIMNIIAQILVPNQIYGIKKHRASAAARRLARTAIDLRLHALEHGTYPPDLDGFPLALLPDPYADGSIRFEHLEGDAARLSYPDADDLWHRDNTHSPVIRPSFVWQLPV